MSVNVPVCDSRFFAGGLAFCSRPEWHSQDCTIENAPCKRNDKSKMTKLEKKAANKEYVNAIFKEVVRPIIRRKVVE